MFISANVHRDARDVTSFDKFHRLRGSCVAVFPMYPVSSSSYSWSRFDGLRVPMKIRLFCRIASHGSNGHLCLFLGNNSLWQCPRCSSLSSSVSSFANLSLALALLRQGIVSSSSVVGIHRHTCLVLCIVLQELEIYCCHGFVCLCPSSASGEVLAPLLVLRP